MASSLHHKESQTLEYENTCQHEQLALDSKWITSIESDGDRANKTEPSHMDGMIRREAQDSGGTHYKIEESTMISDNTEILVESFQLCDEQTLNHISEDNSNPEQIFRDSADMSTFVAGASNLESSTDSSTLTETSGLETSSILSVLNCEDNLRESESASQLQLVMLSQTPPAPHLQHCEPCTSSVNPSTSFGVPSPVASGVYAPAPASRAMVRPQTPDQVFATQLWDAQAASPPYDGMTSPLAFMPPPPYTAQPPGYDTIPRTCSVSTISELQRSAPFTWEMPPSYDSRDSDRLCLVQDRRQRSTSTGDWNKKNFLCCVSFAVVIFIGLVALGFFVNSAAQ